MDDFTVWKQYKVQKSSVHLRNRSPTAEMSIHLNDLANGMVDSVLNSFESNHDPVWPLAHGMKILCKFHKTDCREQLRGKEGFLSRLTTQAQR